MKKMLLLTLKNGLGKFPHILPASVCVDCASGAGGRAGDDKSGISHWIPNNAPY